MTFKKQTDFLCIFHVSGYHFLLLLGCKEPGSQNMVRGCGTITSSTEPWVSPRVLPMEVALPSLYHTEPHKELPKKDTLDLRLLPEASGATTCPSVLVTICPWFVGRLQINWCVWRHPPLRRESSSPDAHLWPHIASSPIQPLRTVSPHVHTGNRWENRLGLSGQGLMSLRFMTSFCLGRNIEIPCQPNKVDKPWLMWGTWNTHLAFWIMPNTTFQTDVSLKAQGFQPQNYRNEVKMKRSFNFFKIVGKYI